MADVITIDFETESIENRPVYPPKPIGLAVTYPTGKTEYFAWGHVSDNNCTRGEASKALKKIYRTAQVNCHNGKFDLEIAEKYFSLPLVPKHGWHDTMLLAFLFYPREYNLKLKRLADKYLKMKASEEEELHNWIIDHVFTSLSGGKGEVVVNADKPKGFKKVPPSKAGAFIMYAPGKLVAKYAKGDAIRTHKLFKKFHPQVIKKGMQEQYIVEKRTVIKSIELEREGVKIDIKTIKPDLTKAKRKLKRAENAVLKKTGEINLNSPKQIIRAFEANDLVTEWEYTEKGNPKTGVDSLLKVCTDKELVKHLYYFSKYTKIIGTYMEPWLLSALNNDGKFFPWYNTIKGDNDKGTYTGRLSSNFQQVPRKPKNKALPHLRNYIIADKVNHLLYNRDYSSQEIRILAHFEDSYLLSAFLQNHDLDVHGLVGKTMAELTGRVYNEVEDRSIAKACDFLAVYGGGASALSELLGIPYQEALNILKAHAEALPGLQELRDDLDIMARNGESFKTAGGRWYDFEPGKEYVALNTLIQGSAADHTKRGLLNIDDMIKTKYSGDARLVLTVHDEFMISGHRKLKTKLMKDFKESMEYDELFELPMLSDGKIGYRWGDMEKVKM